MASAATEQPHSPEAHAPAKSAGGMVAPVWCPKVDNPPTGSNKKKKRSKGGKSAAKRGPTALAPSRGSGFEGESGVRKLR